MKENKTLMGIYCIKNLINNKVYVGQSVDIEHRIYTHFLLADKDIKNSHLYNAIKKYGKENFEPSILSVTTDRRMLNELEYKWIIALDACNPNKGYNIRIENGTTYEHSEETKNKISESNKGKPKSEEHKANMPTKYKKGVSIDPYIIQKRNSAIKLAWKEGRHSGNTTSNSGSFTIGHIPVNKGKSTSDETKEKQRLAKIGKKLTEEHKQNIVLARGYKPICRFTLDNVFIEEFDSFQDIIDKYGDTYLQPGIHSCCNGNKSYYKDSIFRYKEHIQLIEDAGVQTYVYSNGEKPKPVVVIRNKTRKNKHDVILPTAFVKSLMKI